jgi:hypothetical protein
MTTQAPKPVAKVAFVNGNSAIRIVVNLDSNKKLNYETHSQKVKII